MNQTNQKQNEFTYYSYEDGSVYSIEQNKKIKESVAGNKRTISNEKEKSIQNLNSLEEGYCEGIVFETAEELFASLGI